MYLNFNISNNIIYMYNYFKTDLVRDTIVSYHAINGC